MRRWLNMVKQNKHLQSLEMVVNSWISNCCNCLTNRVIPSCSGSSNGAYLWKSEPFCSWKMHFQLISIACSLFLAWRLCLLNLDLSLMFSFCRDDWLLHVIASSLPSLVSCKEYR